MADDHKTKITAYLLSFNNAPILEHQDKTTVHAKRLTVEQY